MQPCASAAKLRGSGPILNRGMEAMIRVGLPPPRIVIDTSTCRQPVVEIVEVRSWCQVAERRTTPSGTSPVVTMRHKAMSSFLASAKWFPDYA